jgi:hypothetical protein
MSIKTTGFVFSLFDLICSHKFVIKMNKARDKDIADALNSLARTNLHGSASDGQF